uniref:Uncharacterized protein n=1 Tax=Anopheles atroparvus TaxID=41427 RepID=A0A182IVW4_ANOAO
MVRLEKWVYECPTESTGCEMLPRLPSGYLLDRHRSWLGAVGQHVDQLGLAGTRAGRERGGCGRQVLGPVAGGTGGGRGAWWWCRVRVLLVLLLLMLLLLLVKVVVGGGEAERTVRWPTASGCLRYERIDANGEPVVGADRSPEGALVGLEQGHLGRAGRKMVTVQVPVEVGPHVRVVVERVQSSAGERRDRDLAG